MKDAALYLEADEDITSAIDKLQKLPGDTVQIVVPKRSTMLQSVINLKLLKKAAADSGKELVLVTNDHVAVGLAGRLGLPVASSLGAKAMVHEVKTEAPAEIEDIIEADEPAPAAEVAKVSAAAALTAAETEPDPTDGPKFSRRQLDEEAEDDEAGEDELPAAHHAPAAKSPKASKVPNFNLMQKRVMWAGVAVALLAAYSAFMYFFTSANVQLLAAASKLSVAANITVDPNIHQTDVNGAVLAGQTVSYSKNVTSTFTATGQQDNGTKASGTMTVSNATGVDQTLVAGTHFAAPDGKTFVSNSDILIPKAYLNPHGDKVNGTATVTVAATANGDSYNEAPAPYTIPNLNNPQITAHGGQMSGGTTKIITVVQQSDVDTAKTAALAADNTAGLQALADHLPKGYVAITASATQAATTVTPTPSVGGQANTASLGVKITYSELAVAKADYDAVLRQLEQTQVGSNNQIYDDGLGSVQLTANGAADATGRQGFNLTTTAYSGAKINLADLAKKLAGKPYRNAADICNAQPGVQQTQVNLWPAWASNLPHSSSKIKINIQVAQ